MESPTGQEKGAPPPAPGGAVEAHKMVKKQIHEPAKRMNFWVPSSLYRRLEDEAEKEGMTMSAWVQIVLLKRPERVIERVLMPAGTKKELDRIPALEKRIDELLKKNQVDVKDYNELLVKKKASDGKLDAALKVLTESKIIKCPGCKKTVQLDFAEDVKRIRELK